MRIIIELEIADEYADPMDLTGVTESAFEGLMDALMPFGDDIDIRRLDES